MPPLLPICLLSHLRANVLMDNKYMILSRCQIRVELVSLPTGHVAADVCNFRSRREFSVPAQALQEHGLKTDAFDFCQESGQGGQGEPTSKDSVGLGRSESRRSQEEASRWRFRVETHVKDLPCCMP